MDRPPRKGNGGLSPAALFRWMPVTRAKTRFALLPRYDDLDLVVEEAPQLPAPRRMLQLAQRFRLDLTDALSGHRELLADFFERVVGVHADAEAHAQHALFARRE